MVTFRDKPGCGAVVAGREGLVQQWGIPTETVTADEKDFKSAMVGDGQPCQIPAAQKINSGVDALRERLGGSRAGHRSGGTGVQIPKTHVLGGPSVIRETPKASWLAGISHVGSSALD